MGTLPIKQREVRFLRYLRIQIFIILLWKSKILEQKNCRKNSDKSL